MDEASPLISIGMPVRNTEKTLTRAVRSIINQTYPHWELLLIDDGSTDETLRIARSFSDPRIGIRADGASLGLPARLNQAVAASRGTYFARMDGDDVSYPARLERQLAYLRDHPEVDLVGTRTLILDPNGTPLGKRPFPEQHQAICRDPVRGFPLAHPTWLASIDFFRRYKYREDAKRSQDQDLLMRAHRGSVFANVPEILLGYYEELNLSKLLRSRRTIMGFAFREYSRRGLPHLAVRAIAEQSLKSAVDLVAVSSGLNYRLLRHRARPITASEASEWEQVARSLGLVSQGLPS
ncbi:MAG: glycosyltransferase [Actinomycetota bacterium]|nr:glycosyltransferase [Actinomycetota bacterium]